MKFSLDFCLFVLVMSLCVLVSAAGASPRVETGVSSPAAGSEEAVVTKIESDKILLRSTSGEKREFYVSKDKYGDLRAGDKVLVEGDTIKKLGEASSPDGMNPPAGDEAAQPEGTVGATGASDPAPARGGSTTGP